MISKTILTLLDRCIQSLNRFKIPWMLMGGLATSVWAEPRATYDLDFVISADPTQLHALQTRLNKYGLKQIPKGTRTIQNLAYLTFLYQSRRTPLYLDLFLARNEYQQVALSRRRPITFRGRKLFVISPEDLVLYKLIAGRGRDLDDVREILTSQLSITDFAYLKRWAKQLGVLTQLEDELISLGLEGKR